MVMVEIDSNAILVEPTKSRKDGKMKHTYEYLLLRMKQTGVQPKKQVLNNEVLESIKNLICNEYKKELELVPLGCYRCNASELAICNFKAHFRNILAGTDPDFQMQLLDCLLPQTKITLHLLR